MVFVCGFVRLKAVDTLGMNVEGARRERVPLRRALADRASPLARTVICGWRRVPTVVIPDYLRECLNRHS